MNLASYLKIKNVGRREFAALIGVSEVAVTRYLKGDRVPRQKHLMRIVEATNGEVTPNDFMGVAGELSAADISAEKSEAAE
jgi:putative transcriptional regulator